ncbi:MAG: hypothetical protein ACFFCW_08755 [Candidatus Hodarchaeota archaeon]
MYQKIVDEKIKKIRIPDTEHNYGYYEHKFMSNNNMDALVNFLSDKLPQKVKICDLGIGFGKKIHYISHKLKELDFDVEVHGVEINKIVLDELVELNKYWDVPLIIHNQNVMEHNVSNYDLIYLYCPLKNSKALYKKIINEMNINSLFFDPSLFNLGSDLLECYSISKFQIWRKIKK